MDREAKMETLDLPDRLVLRVLGVPQAAQALRVNQDKPAQLVNLD